jgi:hypothetical protein
MRKVTVEHRPVSLPSAGLVSPKYTAEKMRWSACRLNGRRAYCYGPLTRHHLVPESWFLRQPELLRAIRNAHANIIPLCRPHHDLVEHRQPVVRLEARRWLRATLTQEEIAFAIQTRGRDWFVSEYPSD